MERCNCTDITYNFNIVSTPLLLYLDGLNYCKCQEIDAECLARQHAVTTYHDLVYDRICEPDKFAQMCGNETSSDCVIDEMTSRNCKQILGYKREFEYDEWIVGWSPFCETYAFGASRDVYDENPTAVSPYNNMPSSCRHLTLFAIAIFYLLCVVIIIANLTVLIVVRLDQYFHTPYGYFKASIALADLFVGTLVVPALTYHMHKLTFSPRKFKPPGRAPGILDNTDEWFLLTVGVLTILTLSVSVYCLTASSMDRYFSIARPFRYEAKKFLTKKRALTLICIIWILSTIFATFPLMTSSTTYAMVSATFILAVERPSTRNAPLFLWKGLFNMTSSTEQPLAATNTSMYYNTVAKSNLTMNDKVMNSTNLSHFKASGNTNGMYLILSMYLFCLFLPLIIVWIVNICTIRAVKRTNQASRRHLAGNINVNNLRISGASPFASSSSPCVSSSTSVSSLHNAGCDDVTHGNDDVIKLENHVQKKLENQSSGEYLTVPSVLKKARHSMPMMQSRSPTLSRDLQRARLSLSLQRVANKRNVKSEVPDDRTKRMSRILLRMVIAFTVCVLPSICSLIAHIALAPYTDLYSTKTFSRKIKLFQNCFDYVSSVFLFGNSFVNCIIYTVLGKRFRDVVGKLYAGKISKLRETVRRFSIIAEPRSKKEETTSPVPKVVEHRV